MRHLNEKIKVQVSNLTKSLEIYWFLIMSRLMYTKESSCVLSGRQDAERRPF